MFCPRCGAALQDGALSCGNCGGESPAAQGGGRIYHHWVTISALEALHGARRTVLVPGAAAPVFLEVPPGTLSGATFTYPDFQVTRGGLQDAVTLRLHLLVQAPPARRRKRPLAALVALLVFFALLARLLSAPTVVELLRGASTRQPAAISTEQAQRSARETIPHFDLRAYLQQLSPELLWNFTQLYDCAARLERSCEMTYPLSEQDIDALGALLYLECPELVQLNFSSDRIYTYYLDADGYASIRFHYSMDEALYAEAYAACERVVQTLCSQMEGMTDYEKELYAYRYLTDNCSYSTTASYAGSAYGALVSQRAKCDGISLAMKWIMEQAGVACLCITGRAQGEVYGHAWNIIALDGAFYDVDLTADMNERGKPAPLYCALNVSSQLLRSVYLPDSYFTDYFLPPGTQSMERSYHVLNGSYVRAGADYFALVDSLLSQAYETGSAVSLQFESRQDFDDFLEHSGELVAAWSRTHALHGITWGAWYAEDYRTFCYYFR